MMPHAVLVEWQTRAADVVAHGAPNLRVSSVQWLDMFDELEQLGEIIPGAPPLRAQCVAAAPADIRFEGGIAQSIVERLLNRRGPPGLRRRTP